MAHVLIVDDEINIRRVLAAMLKRDGYEVTTAADGEQAQVARRLHLRGEQGAQAHQFGGVGWVGGEVAEGFGDLEFGGVVDAFEVAEAIEVFDVAEDFEAGFFLGEAGGDFFVEFEEEEAAGADFVDADTHQQCKRTLHDLTT